jgi:hypothetical protein
LAYVAGFDGNVRAMLAFERQWKLMHDNLNVIGPMQIADLGRSLIGSWQETNVNAADLHYIATGTIGVLQSQGEQAGR